LLLKGWLKRHATVGWGLLTGFALAVGGSLLVVRIRIHNLAVEKLSKALDRSIEV
jgi:hypothetical protein